MNPPRIAKAPQRVMRKRAVLGGKARQPSKPTVAKHALKGVPAPAGTPQK